MINALILATVSASIAYFVIAFIATMHDRLMSRFPNYSYMNNLPEPEIDYAEIITELEKEMQIFEAKLLPVAIAPVTTTAPAELPNSIRGLREFIRANELQAVVKERIGKTVSKCSKDELLQAIA